MIVGGNGYLGVREAKADTTYTVQSGDYLYLIGEKYGIPWQDIADANNIQSPYTIYPGQILKIPIPDSTTPTDTAPSTSTYKTIATGNSLYDSYDSIIVRAAIKHGIKDVMIIKAMIAQESWFDPLAISKDSPCGIPSGWKEHQSNSFGLMQVTPACIEPNNGRPNLTTNQSSPRWSTSWFNPQYNIDRGVQVLSAELTAAKDRFSGCSEDQYMKMAIGAYNSGAGSIFGCNSWNNRAATYINSVQGHYSSFAEMAAEQNQLP